MAELPQGTVTLVFTDIEGSTRLLTALGSRYEAVLADHRRLLRAAFSSHAGVEVDTQGGGPLLRLCQSPRRRHRGGRGAAGAFLTRLLRRRRTQGPHGHPLRRGEPSLTKEGYVGPEST